MNNGRVSRWRLQFEWKLKITAWFKVVANVLIKEHAVWPGMGVGVAMALALALMSHLNCSFSKILIDFSWQARDIINTNIITWQFDVSHFPMDKSKSKRKINFSSRRSRKSRRRRRRRGRCPITQGIHQRTVGKVNNEIKCWQIPEMLKQT